MKRVSLTYNGQKVHAVIVTYTQHHENIPIATIEEKQLYEKGCGKCSQRAHIDVHSMVLNVDELSLRKDEDLKGTLWYRVRKIECTMNEFLFTFTAINNRGKTTMQQIIPTCNINMLNIHFLNPRREHRDSNMEKCICDLSPDVIEEFK